MSQADEIRSQQKAAWDGPGGEAWVAAQTTMDAMFEGLAAHLASAVTDAGASTFIDIGCGTGASTLAACRAIGDGANGTGVDISSPMLALARQRAAAENLPADFFNADAETYAFAPQAADMVISRFGVMFFGDPFAAFTNIRGAMKPGGGLHMLAWRSPQDNHFMTVGTRTARPLLPELPESNPDGPGQFAFADRDKVERILSSAGWTEIAIEPVDFECAFPAADLDLFVHRLGPVANTLRNVEEPRRSKVVEAMKAAFSQFSDGETVRYTAGCWKMTATA